MIDQSNEGMSTRVKHLKDAGLLKTHELKEDAEILHSDIRLTKDDFILSITAEDGTVYEFERPSFECKLVCTDDRSRVYFKKDNKLYYQNTEGEVHIVTAAPYDMGDDVYDDIRLTPIKKAWYEYESNFPALLKVQDEYYIETYPLNEGTKFLIKTNKMRLATKEEILSLYVEE